MQDDDKVCIFEILIIILFVLSIYTINSFCPMWYRAGIATFILVNLIFAMALAAKVETAKARAYKRRKACFGSGAEEHF